MDGGFDFNNVETIVAVEVQKLLFFERSEMGYIVLHTAYSIGISVIKQDHKFVRKQLEKSKSVDLPYLILYLIKGWLCHIFTEIYTEYAQNTYFPNIYSP